MNDSHRTQEAPQTAGEAIKSIQNILRDLTGSAGLGIIPDDSAPNGSRSAHVFKHKDKEKGTAGQGKGKENGKDASNVQSYLHPCDHNVHKLSKVSLARTQRSLLKALDTLRASIVARESWSDGISERLIRVKADTTMKVQATKTSKRAISVCKHLALTEDPFESRALRAVHRLQSLAERCGAMIFSDDQGPSKRELTISGTKFIVIFSFSDLSPQSPLQVETTFEFLNADESNRSEPGIASSFAALLKAEKFDLLDRAFQTLMQVEELNKTVANVSLCDALHAFEDTLLDAHGLERDALNALNLKMIESIGHGLIRRTALGLRIRYMSNHFALLGIEPSSITRHISTSRLRVITVSSQQQPTGQNLQQGPNRQQANAQQPGSNGMSSSPSSQQLPPIDFADGESIGAYVQYVLILNPPVFVSLSVARLLERVAGGEDAMKAALRAGSVRTAPVRDISGSRDSARMSDPGDKRGLWPNLQTLLAPRVFGPPDMSHLTQQQQQQYQQAQAKPAQHEKHVNERSHWSQSSTELRCSAALPNGKYMEFSHSGGDVVAAVALQRVPVTHPRDVHAVLAVLRQQIVFNSLFQSCFGAPIATEQRQRVLRQAVEVAFTDSPLFLRLSFFDPGVDDIVSLVVNIGLGGDTSITLRCSSGNGHPCSNQKASAFLRVCRNLPLTIQSILQVSARSNN